MSKIKTIAAITAASFVLAPLSGALANNGIQALIQVTQLKSQNANDEALDAADKQRELVKKQKEIREAQKTLSPSNARKPAPAEYQVKLRQIKTEDED